MAPHSSTLAWKIPWMEEPSRLQSMGSLRVGHNFTFTFHFLALEKEMATHSSVLAWRIPGTGEPGGLRSMGSLESDTTEQLHFHFSLSCIGEGNGNPLQCSCLENPREGGAWWAAVYGVTQSRTWLKWLSSSSRFSCLRVTNIRVAALNISKQSKMFKYGGTDRANILSI